mgnify:CR=1 FL=1
MKFKQLHPDAILPTKGSEAAGGYDIYMPQMGSLNQYEKELFPLGFAAEVPPGYVAMILPRSGTGAKKGVELVNTCGVIDSDYRGEWMAMLILKKDHESFIFDKGERLLQFVLVPALSVQPEWADELSDTSRGEGGFGSSGQ